MVRVRIGVHNGYTRTIASSLTIGTKADNERGNLLGFKSAGN